MTDAKRLGLVAAFAAAVFTTAVLAQAAVPVTVGLYGDDFDACGSQGQVTGLNPDGDNFLAVRVGPGVQYEKLGELHKGDVVNVCQTEDGWLGIVYRTDGDGFSECGVGTPLPRGPYQGPCKTGWVSERFIVIIAG